MKSFKSIIIVIVTIILTILPVSLVSAADSPDLHKLNYGQIVLGNYNEPVSLEQIENARTTVANEAVLLGNITPNGPKCALTLPEGYQGEIIAYAFVIDKNGTPNQYVGVAGNYESVSTILEKASDWYKNTLTPTHEDEYNARGSDWKDDEPLASFNDDYYQYPYGGVSSTVDIHYLYYDEDATHDWYAVKQFHSIEPGCHVWPGVSNWESDQSGPYQDWGWGELEDDLLEWDPTTTTTGDQTISVSLTGGKAGVQATLTWAFDHPDIVTYDDTSDYYDKAAWLMDISGNPREYTLTIGPGSDCKTYQQSSGTYDLVKVGSKGKFELDWIYSQILEMYWPIEVTY